VAIRATISLKQVQASTSVIKVEAQTTYQNSNATGIWIDPDSNNRFANDELPLSEVLINVFSKVLEDTYVLADISALNVNKPLTVDSLSFTDTFARVVAWQRDFTDAFTLDDLAQIDKDFYGNKGNIFAFTDIIGLTNNKNLTDSYTVGDVFTRVVSYSRSFTDSFAFTDSNYTTFTKIITDALTMGDSLVKDISGVKDTDTLGISEILANSLSKVFSLDTTTISDSLYSALTKNISDSIPFNDSTISNITKVITDAFTLDDSALVNKNYYGNKGNVLTFSDVLVIAITFVRSYTDSFSFSDESSYQLGKSIQGAGESVSMSDLIATAIISGKVLNGGIPLNRITLN
jgi:hypothetical protein